MARRVGALGVGTRVEVVWVDASGCQEEDGARGTLGALQLLRSVGYISAVSPDSLVTVRNESLVDETHRDTETIALVNIVRVERLVSSGEGAVECRRWLRRPWVREAMGGKGGG